MGHTLVDDTPDVQLSLIMITQKQAPIVLRLDGIYFNTAQDWEQLNEPICASYKSADAVIVQSEFDRELIERYFGPREDVHVIRNGTDIPDEMSPLQAPQLDQFDNVWCCASSWRPHKRLAENVRYFQEKAGSNDCLVIAGENPDVRIADPRIFYAGQLDRPALLSLYDRSSHFLHLPWLGHCDNVLIDARAHGCHIVTCDSGGTREIAGKGSTIIRDKPWDWLPHELYKPPKLDFSDVYTGTDKNESNIDIEDVAQRYLDVFHSIIK